LLQHWPFFGNCEKNNSPVDVPDDPIDTTQTPIDTSIIGLGKGFVLKNGTSWAAPFKAWYHANTHSRLQVRAEITSASLRSESLFLHDIPCEVGKHPVEYYALKNFNNRVPEVALMQDYDQPIGDFLADTTRSDHFLEVLRYDSIAKTVECRFQVFLGKKPTNVPWPGVPDSIFLTEGRFHLKIEDP